MGALGAAVRDTLNLGKHAIAEALERKRMEAPEQLPASGIMPGTVSIHSLSQLSANVAAPPGSLFLASGLSGRLASGAARR